MKKGILKKIFLITVLYLIFIPYIFSQAAGVRGSVSGVVKSTEGVILANAKVKISGDLLPAGREYVTGNDGVFRFLSLVPGKYKLEITHPEMMDLTIEVTVALDRETQVEAVMTPVGRVVEEVVVTAVAPLVDVKSTEISTNFDKSIITNLPLGRTYDALFQLAPGVPENRDFAPNAGGNKQDNVFLYDGANITNPHFGYLSSNFSELDIQEINIKRGAISAEFGRAVGMVTNAITKSGTNTLSGSFRFVYEPAEWLAKYKDPTIVTKTDVLRPSIGLGGPILKNKLWWYLSGNIPRTTTTDRVNKLGSVPDAKYSTNEFFLKLSANPHPKHLILASFRNSDSLGKNAGIGVYDHPSTATNSDGLNRIIYFSWTWNITPTTYLEFKYDRAEEKSKSVPVTELGYKPSFDPTSLWRMGYFKTVSGYIVGGATDVGQYVGGAYMYNTQNFSRDEVKIVLSKYFDFKGHSHLIKAGFGYDNGEEYLDRVANGWGLVEYFSNIAAYVGGSKRPGFRGRYWSEQTPQESTGRTYGIFVQDTASIGERLTLYLGALLNRDEYLTFGKSKFNFQTALGVKETRDFKFNFDEEIQPRIGFTYILDKNAGDKLYANYGRYNAMDNRSIARAAAPLRLYQTDAYFEITGTFIKEVPSVAETGKVILPDIKPTYQDEYVFGYSRPLFGKKWVVDIWGQYRNVKNVIEDYPPATLGKWIAPGSFVYGNVSWAKRKYQAFTIQVQRPFAEKWSLFATYTWSKLYGNWDLDYAATALFYASSALDDCPGLYMTDPNRYGILAGDRTHLLKIFGTWEFFKRTTLGGYLRIQSGAPWQAQGRSWWYSYRTYLEKAGSRRLNPWTNFDLQLSHVIPLGRFNGIIEARFMNVLNRQTTLSVDTTQYFDVEKWDPYIPKSPNPNFGLPTSYAPPRRFVITFYLNF